jgi:hypothetical protein
MAGHSTDPEKPVNKLARLVISLPLLIVPLAGLVHQPAQAGELSAAQGLTILAMAQTADRRCHVLSAAEHGELASYRSRAEMAALTLVSKQQRNTAIAEGVARGKAAPCTAATAADIRETLKAAREAVAAADGRVPDSKPDSVDVMKPAGSADPVTLATYTRLVKPYFADLRCHNLSGGDARRYFRAVVRLQRGMIKKFGTPAVADAQLKAKRAANGMSCKAAGPAAVQGLADITGR